MIYVFHKKKIISYILATFFVLILFAVSASTIPNEDVELIKVSSNVIPLTENNGIENTENNFLKNIE